VPPYRRLAALQTQGIWTVAFQNSMDALRFCHAIQMVLMQVRVWRADASSSSPRASPEHVY
jgi:hypothetical protein